MIQLLVWSLIKSMIWRKALILLYGAGTPSNLAIMGGIKSMIWRKALILVGVTLLAMTGIGLVVLLFFFLGKRMITMMTGYGRCSCRGPGERRYHE